MKRKFSPIEEIEAQLTLADKISRLIIHTSSVEEVARGTVIELAGLMPIDWAILALVDVPAGKAIPIPLVGDISLGEEDAIPLPATPFAWVAEKKQALFEPDLRREKRFPLAILGEEVRTLVHMPLFYQGEVFGVLTTGSHQPDVYGDSQLRLLRHAVAHLAISLKSALLLEQNLRTEASLTDLNELLSVITSSPELPEVFPQFARRLREVVPFDRLSLAHIEGNALRILAVFDEKDSHPKVDEVCLVSDSAIPWMQEHGEINVEEDFDAERRFPIDELHLQEGFRGEIRVPLFSHGKLFASLHLVSLEPYRLKEEPAFLSQLAHHLATPVESYVLYCHEKQRLDWLAALAHHLGTPITPIVASSELLAEDLQQEGKRAHAELAQNILSAAQGLNRNLKLFRDLSEVQSPSLSLALETIDPKPILSQAVEEAFAGAEAKSQSLALELPETLPQVFADPSRIKQVLRIFLVNAIKASPEKGRIQLRAKAEERELVIEVVDAGPHFSAEERERLLQPYRLSEADRRAFPELTLNLAIARRLIELHGGRFWLDRKPKKGNIFGFCLPVALNSSR